MRDPRPDGLSRRQLGALVWGALVSSLVRMAPGSMLPAAGGGAWLSAALSVPGVLVLGLVLGLLLSLRRPGEGLGSFFAGPWIPGRAGLWRGCAPCGWYSAAGLCSGAGETGSWRRCTRRAPSGSLPG